MNRAFAEIKSDLYSIADRVKEIDAAYFIVFNKRLKRFEVHAESRRGRTFELALPFNRLDARVLTLIRKTRVVNGCELIAEAEKNNERLLKLEAERIAGRAKEKADRILTGRKE
jgi:hypothetical protein